jgi:hypothetical protein
MDTSRQKNRWPVGDPTIGSGESDIGVPTGVSGNDASVATTPCCQGRHWPVKLA